MTRKTIGSFQDRSGAFQAWQPQSTICTGKKVSETAKRSPPSWQRHLNHPKITQASFHHRRRRRSAIYLQPANRKLLSKPLHGSITQWSKVFYTRRSSIKKLTPQLKLLDLDSQKFAPLPLPILLKPLYASQINYFIYLFIRREIRRMGNSFIYFN